MSSVDGGVTIAAVERDTGIGKDTLRIWERRYGFPAPGRNSFGERTYPATQVDKLRVVKRLIDAGFRPGRIVALPLDELVQMGGVSREAALRRVPASVPEAQACLELLRAHDLGGLRRRFDLAQMHLGLGRFITEWLTPLNTLVGEAWIQGQIEIFEEHAYTELVQRTLQHALHSLPASTEGSRPRVLLTTLRDEPHGLGLLMAEAQLLVQGAPCTSLGIQTPVADVVRAGVAFNIDIVALSFTACNGPNAVLNGLAELRELLPAHVELWAGGAVAAFERRHLPGVRIVPELALIASEMQRWRALHL